jgi:hypothetical protein
MLNRVCFLCINQSGDPMELDTDKIDQTVLALLAPFDLRRPT